MKRILVILAAASFAFFASCSNSGAASLRFHNASADQVRDLVIGGNAVSSVAAGGYSAAFEFEADTWVDSSWDYAIHGHVDAGYRVKPGAWDIRWDGANANLVER